MREIDRGGQVFYVHNRVETIEGAAARVRRLVPRARVAIGHGQMAEGMLERVMLDFDAGLFDVLVCTTIIESGLDIPNANTMLIARADTFGLAQLYQLRGRVGRSDRRAYAYLLHRRGLPLSGVARRRLHAIFSASDLGAGYQIALSDLEIRGAGNILGPEQSGSWQRSASSCTPDCSPRRWTCAGAAFRHQSRRRSAWSCPDRPSCRMPTWAPPEPSWRCIGASPRSRPMPMRRRCAPTCWTDSDRFPRGRGPLPGGIRANGRGGRRRVRGARRRGRLTLKWRRYDRAVVTRALIVAGFRPVAGSNQVRIPLVRAATRSRPS